MKTSIPACNRLFPRIFIGLALLCVLACPLTAPVGAQIIDGTYNVTESWTVTLQYTRFGSGNFSGTKTFSGTETGTIVIKNGAYKLIDRTGVAWSYPGRDLKARSIYDYGYGAHISGDYVFAPGYGLNAFGLVFMGCFAKKVPMLDGEVPAFYDYSKYSANGTTLASMTGGGNMRGQSLKATVSSSISLRLYVGPPNIAQQPKKQTVLAGQDATFTVVAGGSPPLTYAWRKGSTLLPGCTDATLTIINAQSSDAGIYSVLVKNPGGQVASASAQLTVNRPPAPWFEGWESASANSWFPASDPETFVRGDKGRWHLGDTVSNFDDCGPALSHADILVENGRKLLKLTSVPNSGGCAENLWVAIDSRFGTSFPVPLLRTSEISFFEQGVLENPQWNGSFNCIVKPCADAVSLELVDDHANRVLYLFQRAPNYVEHAITNTSSGAYLEVFLDPAGGVFSRNLFDDFARVAGANIGKSIVSVEFQVGSAGWAVLDDLRIGPASGTSDITRPTLAITSPARNARLDNPNLVARGTARDNAQVFQVWCQLNDDDWTLAQTANGWLNWTTTSMLLEPGPNTLRAFAIDTSGNRSATNSVTFTYVLKDKLIVDINGSGTVIPNLNGKVLELETLHSMTAKPGKDYVFSNWTGGVLLAGDVLTNGPALKFVMKSNLVLEANFIPNPFLPVKGTCYGLFYEDEDHGGVKLESSGALTLTLSSAGSYSAALKLGGAKYPFSGKFDVAGSSTKTILRPRTNTLTVHMTLNLADPSGGLAGTVTDGTWTANLVADLATFDGRTRIAPWKGKYTLIFPGTPGDDSLPGGDSYGWASVDSLARVSLGGSLADKTSISSMGVPISAEGNWPLFLPLNGGKACLLGWLHFDTNGPAITGPVSWIKKAQPSAKYYPDGFTNVLDTIGSPYHAPPNSSTRVLGLTNAIVTFHGAALTQSFTNPVTLSPNNRVTNHGTNTLAMTLNLSKGSFTGKAIVPGTKQSIPFQGVLLQDLNCGRGYFVNTNITGPLWFGSTEP